MKANHHSAHAVGVLLHPVKIQSNLRALHVGIIRFDGVKSAENSPMHTHAQLAISKVHNLLKFYLLLEGFLIWEEY